MAIAEVGKITHFKQRVNTGSPDYIAESYGRTGEFGPSADIAFDKHVDRLKKMKDFFKGKISDILKCEGLWYGRE